MKPYYSLSDFPDRKNAGKNFIARCPKCGTMHLYISKAKGLYHCFYAGCEFNGILTDYCKDKRPMFSYPKEKSSDRTGTYPPPGTRHLTDNLPEYRNATENNVNEVPMLPGDYKILSPAVLQKSSRWTNRPSVRILTNWQHAVIWPIRASLSPQPSQRISAACVITASPRTVRTNANRLPPSFPASPT